MEGSRQVLEQSSHPESSGRFSSEGSGHGNGSFRNGVRKAPEASRQHKKLLHSSGRGEANASRQQTKVSECVAESLHFNIVGVKQMLHDSKQR